ncbi:uncharacterized protein EV420DRAFT_1538556 [Desarmillaria tabescens]|uniref:Uncharacterized protein n=1 Tax=Armillaria tabescens TaxID=1929756 RepID=A0AA39KE50_ARMTA|nr:uncharacterized protein EV420DRAFT_1538556 [Desarmillaria tabescens]KAK0459143.1 hypothetical protein EV420DRAFT_1538556 [Desarmillaria tabescens]
MMRKDGNSLAFVLHGSVSLDGTTCDILSDMLLGQWTYPRGCICRMKPLLFLLVPPPPRWPRQTLMTHLNGLALDALVHGTYTALVGVTLSSWYIFINPTIRQPKSHTNTMPIPVVLMYLFAALNLGIQWS